MAEGRHVSLMYRTKNVHGRRSAFMASVRSPYPTTLAPLPVSHTPPRSGSSGEFDNRIEPNSSFAPHSFILPRFFINRGCL